MVAREITAKPAAHPIGAPLHPIQVLNGKPLGPASLRILFGGICQPYLPDRQSAS
jgi:hypothetical protein